MSRSTGKDGSQSQNEFQRRFHRVMDTYRALRRSQLRVYPMSYNGAHRDSLDFVIDCECKAKRCGVRTETLMFYAINQNKCPVELQEALGDAFVHIETAYAKTFALVSSADRFESGAEPVFKIAAEEPEMLEGGYPSANDILEVATVPISELPLDGEGDSHGE